MESASTSALQKRIDAIAYPPTMTYRLDGLVPGEVLAQRLERILELVPDFFKANRFLDVGCSKGYFMLRAAEGSSFVDAIDTDSRACRLCHDLAPPNVRVRQATLTELREPPYDRIFIGNTHHYLYRDRMGWDWTVSLARLSIGTVVIEGPTGMECQDMQTAIPAGLRHGFNRRAFMEAMHPQFVLHGEVPSPDYTPDRYIMHFERQDDLIWCTGEEFTEFLGKLYGIMGKWVLPTDHVAEVCVRHDRGRITRQVIKAASFVGYDRNPMRGEQLDVLGEPVPAADVVISTAILHHVEREDWPVVIDHLTRNTRRLVMVSGPLDNHPTYGDHKSHLNAQEIERLFSGRGWLLEHTREVGKNRPHAEVLMVFKK